jgi:hypothetical protein
MNVMTKTREADRKAKAERKRQSKLIRRKEKRQTEREINALILSAREKLSG